VIYSNPALALKRKPVRPKQLELPNRAQFAAFIPEMQNGHGRDSKNCAELAQGLAFTGCRISYAVCIQGVTTKLFKQLDASLEPVAAERIKTALTRVFLDVGRAAQSELEAGIAEWALDKEAATASIK
jgi:hypothetical protein